jgi:DNA-binding transcriptional LysR family regulator
LDWLWENVSFFHFMPDTGIGKLIAHEAAKHEGSKTAQIIMLDNLEAIMECVSKGLGFTLLPETDIDRYRHASVGKIRRPNLPNRALVLVAASQAAVAKHLTTLASLLNCSLVQDTRL